MMPSDTPADVITPSPTPLPSDESVTTPSNSTHDYTRLGQEWIMFKRLWIRAMLLLFWLLYWGFFASRKLAYYRHVPLGTLRDMGHEIIPHLSWAAVISEWLQYSTVFGVMIGLLLWLFVTPKGVPVIGGIGLLYRYLLIECFGYTLRSITYLPTSLPGCDEHCLPNTTATYSHPPKDLLHVFIMPTSDFKSNCGDLLFSGHIFQMVTSSLMVYHYLIPGVWRTASVFMLILATVAQSFVSLSSRGHYSVDVIVAVYASFFVWHSVFWLVPDRSLESLRPSNDIGIPTP